MLRDVQNNLPKQMKRFRLERLWTLDQMARVCGISVTAVWQIENGQVTPHELTVAKIRRALPSLFEEIPL